MSDTVIIQSYRANDVPDWLARCLDSVRGWAAARNYAYRFLGDELFDPLPATFRLRAGHLPQMLADLGRLHAIQAALDDGVRRAVWFDADILVFAPDRLELPDDRDHYLCREVWIESDRVEDRINNCVCSFTARSALLPFYRDACAQIIDDAVGALDPLAVGTRLLTALDRIVKLPTLESIGLASPYVLRELAGTGRWPDALVRRHRAELAAVNLCASFRGTTIRPANAASFVVDDELYRAASARLSAVATRNDHRP